MLIESTCMMTSAVLSLVITCLFRDVGSDKLVNSLLENGTIKPLNNSGVEYFLDWLSLAEIALRNLYNCE